MQNGNSSLVKNGQREQALQMNRHFKWTPMQIRHLADTFVAEKSFR